MTAIAARARGLTTQLLAPEVLARLEAARDRQELALALARAGLSGVADASAVDRLARDRVGGDLATLARWSAALAPVALDEDRRSIRAIVRGLAASLPRRQKLAGTVPTPLLPGDKLEALADARALPELAEALGDHPFAGVIAGARSPIDPLAIELALAARFAGLAHARDRALRTYLAQAFDAENAATAVLLAERGTGIDARDAFVAGGRLLDRKTFLAAAGLPVADARARIGTSLARTPLARALFAAEPSALEAATLDWQLETQRRLRRTEPLGLAPAIYLVLRRRDEARHLRHAAWRLALAGGAA